ncbi:S-adenosylmethionine sensor upstream of mTORC1 [Zophobas morio]|uniref:S-adenosylmethionine sensor upstream of mTORC1 n=1 Tax=Zophobas morio TaxID=2755281 RepID=UPI0030836B73
MASVDHLASSDFIKTVHQRLRDESKISGVEEAWKKHCQDEENLKKYAAAMHNLAENHWENNYKINSKPTSRIAWVHQFCQIYFIEEELLKYRQRENEIADKINLKIGVGVGISTINKQCRLLDVGSCYNPFQKYTCFDVLPIDIAPAISGVYKCDFINLHITLSASSVHDNLEITELQQQSFDVVVFSLLLEYLPSPQQRLLACKNAYKLLKTEGILFIITPDSKHVGANTKIMKSWRFLLAKEGFSRIKYEKLAHLHCMVFRKCLSPEISQRWATLHKQENFYSEFVIPQDFKQTKNSTTMSNVACEASLFDELPNFFE